MISGIALFLFASAQILGTQGGELNYDWQSYIPGSEQIPSDAVVAGYDVDRSIIYVSQIRVGREKIPAQLIPSKSVSYAVYKGGIHKSALTAEPTPILCGKNYEWVSASMGNFPKNAIPSGKTEAGETLYVGRGEVDGAIIIGGVSPKHSALFAVFNGEKVQWFGMYKVLVYNNIDQWVRASFDEFPTNALVGGYDNKKQEVYIGSVRVGNQVIPAHVHPVDKLATASYSGGLVQSEDFQLLVGGNYQWKTVKSGAKIPSNAVIGGVSGDGEAMYIGRILYKKFMLPGAILAHDKVLYISYLGKLRTVESGYQVLVHAS